MSALNRTFSSRLSYKSQPASPIADTAAGASSSESEATKALTAVKDLMRRAAEDINESMLSSILDVLHHSDAIDDRKMLLENVLTFLANHPPGKVQDFAQGQVIRLLYNDLSHPPPSFLGPQYAFRTADGSNNNTAYPDLGKAGMPYARSVQQGNPLPANQLPDSGLVFDTLLRRNEFRKHPAGLSSMMFGFAATVIHSVFRTDHRNPNINLTSGYVDLAPLYGNDQAMQDKIRIKDGRGCLHPDTFAEDRLLLLPPSSAVILVLFNRNHNYIARRLLEINERGTWVDPSTLPPNSDQLLKQEEEIFQITRLCNAAWFAAVVFSDYLSAILGLVRQGSSWSLIPFGEMRDADHSIFERGRGNACSVEFNCLYRWHATTSVQDEAWIQRQFENLFPGKDPEQLTLADFFKTSRALEEKEPGVEHWTFDELQRQADGSFNDSDLAKILQDATSDPAAAFGARGTPGIMKVNEIMGIEANRIWGVCSLNDFRKFLGLKTYSSFEEWNPDKEVAEAAERLYGHIDNLELYVGLQAEDTKPVIEGAGLCPGYTISRAILADAIALTRGDRFFTDDFTPYNMTAWGFADCQRDPSGWGFGSTLGRLLLRTLPNDYDEKSVYTWFPLMDPEAMATYLKNLGQLDNYSLERPKKHNQVTTVSGYVEVGEVLRDTQNFTAVAHHRANEVIKGKGFFSASVDSAQVQKEFIGALAPTSEAMDKIGQYFYSKTTELISAASYSLVNTNTRGVNIVDVLKRVPICWAASEVAGITLKDKAHPSGAYTPQELYNILGEIYEFIFLEVESAKYMVMKQKVQKHIDELSHHIKSSFGIAGSRLSLAGIFGTVFGRKRNEQNELLKRLFELGHSNEQVINEILALLVGVTVEVSLALTNVVNLLLDVEGGGAFRTQATSAEIKDLSVLEAHVIEALRIDPPFAGVSVIAQKEHAIGSLAVQPNEHLFLDVASANMNEEAFVNATTFDATRTPRERYIQANAAFKAVGADIAPKIIAQVARSVFSLENVRRGPGQCGKLQRFQDSTVKDLRYAYLNAQQFRSAWPTSMVLLYDTPSPAA